MCTHINGMRFIISYVMCTFIFSMDHLGETGSVVLYVHVTYTHADIGYIYFSMCPLAKYTSRVTGKIEPKEMYRVYSFLHTFSFIYHLV